MEAKFITKEKDALEVQLTGCDEGMARLIAEVLSENKKVGYASVSLDHPLTANPVLHIKAPNAKEAVEKAIEQTIDRISAAQKAAKKLGK